MKFLAILSWAVCLATLNTAWLSINQRAIASLNEAVVSQRSPQALLQQQGDLEQGDSTLDDGSFFDEYRFEGQADQQVTIELESTDFDAYLILLDPNGEAIAQNDDAVQGSFNAALTVRLPSSGIYTVIANSYDSSGRGSYSLSVNEVESAIDSSSPRAEVPIDVRQYIGLRYVASPANEESELPGSPTYVGGWVLGDPFATNGIDGRYGVVQFQLEGSLIIALEEYVEYDSSGNPTRHILDAISLPIDGIASVNHDGEHNVQSSCAIGANADPEIFAVVRHGESEYSTDIRQAWRANRSTGRIEAISPNGIRCENFAWGV